MCGGTFRWWQIAKSPMSRFFSSSSFSLRKMLPNRWVNFHRPITSTVKHTNSFILPIKDTKSDKFGYIFVSAHHVDGLKTAFGGDNAIVLLIKLGGEKSAYFWRGITGLHCKIPCKILKSKLVFLQYLQQIETGKHFYALKPLRFLQGFLTKSF